ncbi:SDR family NAD(P)-dependent oxidoreductase, partial [Rhizobium sp. SIMBA_035]
GRALALAYAAPGVVVGLIGRYAARLDEVAAACQARGAAVECGRVDVCDAEAMCTWLNAFDDTHPIDLLIANAGVASTLA